MSKFELVKSCLEEQVQDKDAQQLLTTFCAMPDLIYVVQKTDLSYQSHDILGVFQTLSLAVECTLNEYLKDFYAPNGTTDRERLMTQRNNGGSIWMLC